MQIMPTFNEIEHAIGGRPTKERKIRMSFYVTKQESETLKSMAQIKDTTLSMMVRELVRTMIHE